MASKNEYTEKIVAGTFTFYLDSGCLLIKIGDDYPCPLSPQATHRLLNLLYDYRRDIINANTEARIMVQGMHTAHMAHKKRKR